MAKRIATHTDKDPTVVYESEKMVLQWNRLTWSLWDSEKLKKLTKR